MFTIASIYSGRVIACAFQSRHSSSDALGPSEGIMTPYRSVVFATLLNLLAGAASAGQEGADMRLEDMGFVMRAGADAGTNRTNAPVAGAKVCCAHKRRQCAISSMLIRDYCQCVFVGNELAMKNYRALVLPPSAPPLPTGPDPGPVSDGWVQIDPGVDAMLGYGDIFDYRY